MLLLIFVATSAALPVNITMATESLCPDCVRAFKNQLSRVFSSNLEKIAYLDLLPYGNAKETQNGSRYIFTCQHGEPECYLNHIDLCAMHLANNRQYIYFPFVHCLYTTENPLQNVDTCHRKVRYPIPLADIEACAKGDLGNLLMHEIAQRTDKLNPPKKYVPYFMIDGVHTEDLQKECEADLVKVVCDHYTGTKPAECS
ncbi:putative Gamma-interferon-inducible lysosomal thiol reductase [Blattamonas nauphoetae]|uniref:Gamma-interferon-inducible lysosomal thiol reductase n=1 Tax=Blattamonas nauphoetae TaxID=2049346 RepID=A0ABQ9X8Y3_9EUKA|nr:putative Gamma-interferon-inducible lysosomal thiol reductase [Blattamonas nauphoetae]